ncbi:MAG: chloramphenicol phosphotransferase CPT family protein [Candidatus Sericytochromatia bacterium]
MPPNASLILLNGVSSSGKSSLAQAFLQASPEPWVYLALDAHLNALQAAYAQGYADLPSEPDSLRLFGETLIDDFVALFHTTVVAYLNVGRSVIVDHVLERPQWQADFLNKTHSFARLCVGLHCAPAELARREQARGDRQLGLAQSQLQTVHAGLTYDLEIDTSLLDRAEALARLLRVQAMV